MIPIAGVLSAFSFCLRPYTCDPSLGSLTGDPRLPSRSPIRCPLSFSAGPPLFPGFDTSDRKMRSAFGPLEPAIGNPTPATVPPWTIKSEPESGYPATTAVSPNGSPPVSIVATAVVAYTACEGVATRGREPPLGLFATLNIATSADSSFATTSAAEPVNTSFKVVVPISPVVTPHPTPTLSACAITW